MTPSPNASGFFALVPKGGFQWVSPQKWRELRDGAEKPYRLNDVQFAEHDFPDPHLVCLGDRDTWAPRRPGTQTTLFRDFAELDPRNPDAIAKFANAHGWLVGVAGGNYFEGADAETLGFWQRGITGMCAAVAVLDAIRSQDLATLRRLFVWERHPLRMPEGWPAFSWTIDLYRGQPDSERTSRGLGKVAKVVRYSKTSADTGRESIPTVARQWLASEVSAHLAGQVDPQLVVSEDGNEFAEVMVPRTLLAAMWSQLFEAVTQDVVHKKCPACGGWFAIGGRATGTRRRTSDRKVYCSDLCRVRACQGRRERAQELAAKGKTPAAIVKVMQDEGHDTDLATVKGWVRGIKRKGG